MEPVKVYKVCIPSYYAWPPGNVILTIKYTKADAEDYIRTYPNVLLRPWLSIDVDEISYTETD